MKSNYLTIILSVQALVMCKFPLISGTDVLGSVELVGEMVDKLEFEINYRILFHFPFIFMGNLKLQPLQGVEDVEINQLIQLVEGEFSTLKSSYSITEAVRRLGKDAYLPGKETLPETLKSKNPVNKSQLLTHIRKYSDARRDLIGRVESAIVRTLRFYETHLDKIYKPDSALALTILKEIDNAHGGNLQKTFPLNKWIETICSKVSLRSSVEGNTCNSMSRQLKMRFGRKSKQGYWKHASILEKRLNQTDLMTLKNIGEEKEETWGLLLGQCQEALLTRCEIPYVCERTLLDPTPRSQYHLTHQLLHRIFIDNMDCPSNPSIKTFARNEQMYTNLCSKIYLEAKYLDILDVQPVHRDLFSEMVGLCGYLGYTNFLREDWLNRILSWQSKSEYGCFFKSPQYPADVLSSDTGFYRRATKVEIEQGFQRKEKCQPHFTATSLLALSVYYDFLMDSKNY